MLLWLWTSLLLAVSPASAMLSSTGEVIEGKEGKPWALGQLTRGIALPHDHLGSNMTAVFSQEVVFLFIVTPVVYAVSLSHAVDVDVALEQSS